MNAVLSVSRERGGISLVSLLGFDPRPRQLTRGHSVVHPLFLRYLANEHLFLPGLHTPLPSPSKRQPPNTGLKNNEMGVQPCVYLTVYTSVQLSDP